MPYPNDHYELCFFYLLLSLSFFSCFFCIWSSSSLLLGEVGKGFVAFSVFSLFHPHMSRQDKKEIKFLKEKFWKEKKVQEKKNTTQIQPNLIPS